MKINVEIDIPDEMLVLGKDGWVPMPVKDIPPYATVCNVSVEEWRAAQAQQEADGDKWRDEQSLVLSNE